MSHFRLESAAHNDSHYELALLVKQAIMLKNLSKSITDINSCDNVKSGRPTKTVEFIPCWRKKKASSQQLAGSRTSYTWAKIPDQEFTRVNTEGLQQDVNGANTQKQKDQISVCRRKEYMFKKKTTCIRMMGREEHRRGLSIAHNLNLIPSNYVISNHGFIDDVIAGKSNRMNS